MMRFWRRHQCPPSVTLSVFIDGQLVVGPMDTEHLAYIVRYAGRGGKLDLLDPDGVEIRGVRVVAERTRAGAVRA